MLKEIWEFFQIKSNQDALQIVGGGAAAIMAGIFAVYRFVKSGNDKNKKREEEKPDSKKIMVAQNKSIVSENVNNSPINIK